MNHNPANRLSSLAKALRETCLNDSFNESSLSVVRAVAGELESLTLSPCVEGEMRTDFSLQELSPISRKKMIRDARRELAWTQADLAREAEVSKKTIENLEVGKEVTPKTMKKVWRALEVGRHKAEKSA